MKEYFTVLASSEDEATEKIKNRGGKVTNSISKKTTYLLLGKEPGSKLVKAQQFGTRILSEQDFLSHL